MHWYSIERHNISPLVTTEALSPIGVAADIMLQNRVRHLLVVKNDDVNKPLGIITQLTYLKLNMLPQ